MSKLHLFDIQIAAVSTLIALKICRFVPISWFWVFSPLWIIGAFCVLWFVGWFIYALIYIRIKGSVPVPPFLCKYDF